MKTTIGELVEWLIQFRDRRDLNFDERCNLADAINLISHGFDRTDSVESAIESGKYNR